MMGTAKHIGRIGALTVSIGAAAVVVMATVVPAPTVSPAVKLSADSTALILCGTTCPTPDGFVIESVKNQFIAPTHPGQDFDYVAVTTPEEFWPISGVFRLLGLALGPPGLFGLDGPAWPDEPLWKLSGLFDRTGDQSLRAGVADLEAAMAAHGNDDLVIFGVSQGAGVVNEEKRKLAEQYPAGSTAPDIDFVLAGDPNLPNGGLASRFAGLYIPILDLSFNGPAPTDTQFKTVEINRQYDGFSDLPLYPLNGISLLNALLGIVYTHLYILDVSLPADPTKSPAYQGKHGDTSYYFFENPDLPLFGPLRTLGVPEPVIDVVEPFFRVLVELGYDRSIPQWEPTPARLIPPLNPGKVAGDLVDAIGEGINNAAALVGLPTAPAPASPAPSIANADISAKLTVSEAVAQPDSSPSTARVSTEPAAQQNTVASTSTASAASEPSVEPKSGPSATTSTSRQPKPAGGPAARRLAGQQSQDVAVPRKRRSTAAGSNGDGAPRVGSTSSPKPAGSSTPASSVGSSSPAGTDS
jgi:PE-PPE domain